MRCGHVHCGGKVDTYVTQGHLREEMRSRFPMGGETIRLETPASTSVGLDSRMKVLRESAQHLGSDCRRTAESRDVNDTLNPLHDLQLHLLKLPAPHPLLRHPMLTPRRLLIVRPPIQYPAGQTLPHASPLFEEERDARFLALVA